MTQLTGKRVLCIYLFRLLCGLAVTTFLFPDEWWQFSEPAYEAVYGAGYLTWDWHAGIRSYLPLLPLISLLKAAKATGICEEWIARKGAVVVMAAWMTLTDVYTVKLAGKFFGSTVRPYAVSPVTFSSSPFNEVCLLFSSSFSV